MEKYGVVTDKGLKKTGGQGPDRCPKCGSQLAGTNPPICPKCGSLPLEPERGDDQGDK